MIKYLILDVDGTMTDGKIYIGNDGEIMKAFNVKDGYGIHNILTAEKIIPIVITGRSSKIVEQRCMELGITNLYQGVSDKYSVLLNVTADFANVAYIGDDVNDVECMKAIKNAGGLVGCPADAVEAIVEISDFVCKASGGNGAVREFIDWIVGQ